MHPAVFFPLAVLPFAMATVHQVQVGVKDGKEGLYYDPDKLDPAVNDTVVFNFDDSEHSVAQSNFDDPCEYIDNGIYSGFPGKGKTFTITINDTEPIWLFCSRPGHCQGGQVLVLNEPNDNTLDAYKEAAKNAQDDGDDDEALPVRGGTVADAADTASSSSSASATAKSTGGSTATSTRANAAASSAASASASSGIGDAAATAASAASVTPTSTESPGAAGRFTPGAGLGALGLLGFLVGGMI